MREAGRVFGRIVCASLMIGGACFFAFASPPAMSVNVPASTGFAVDDEDGDTPDVTARVARVSFLRGDAKVKHADSPDWENVVLNLPVVEGDEIATETGSRVEIQFDNYQHVRLAENSYLKVVTLKDGGIALSVSLGTMSARITAFDKDQSFFEVDAPKTTLAVQKAGNYRIDAGQAGDAEIRMSVTGGGEARIYSDTAGFTLKNDRSARIFIDGDNAGEWEAADASRFTDEFDTWALDRDTEIASRLAGAYYDKYYDQDIYGADDLNGYGDWVFTNNYGYVWRPYASAINTYADWTPYRYGHWRWIPPYGWTWINEEPWGWATYHHGRWFYDNGFWYWSPYGYYRYARSWWFPALVVLNIFNNNVCWYPLPYHYHYYNYNWHHNHHGGGGGGGGGHHVPIVPHNNDTDPYTPGTPIKQPPVTTVPTKAVLAVSTAAFGTTVKNIQTAPQTVASSVLSIKVRETDPPQLPIRTALTGKVTSDIIRPNPKSVLIAQQTKVGAATRQEGEPLDKELRTTRVFGGRKPVQNDTGGVKNASGDDTRPTGAVSHPVIEPDTEPTVKTPVYSPPAQTDPPVKHPVREPKYDPPVKQPVYSPPSPPVKSPPRSDPPTKSPPPTKVSPSSKPSDGGGASKKSSSKSD